MRARKTGTGPCAIACSQGSAPRTRTPARRRRPTTGAALTPRRA
jgi:hypothetical protein